MDYRILMSKFNNCINKLNISGSSPYQNIFLTKKSVNKLVVILNQIIFEMRNDGSANKDSDFNFYYSLYKQIHSLTSSKPFFEKDGYIFNIKIKE